MSEVNQKPKTTLKENSQEGLSYIYEAMNLPIPQNPIDISGFTDQKIMAETEANKRIGAALAFFIESVVESGQTIEKIDKASIDYYIAELDRKISVQLDEIIHHEDFKKLESSWRGLKFLVDRIDFNKNIKVDIMDISKDDLAADFEDSPELTQSSMHKLIYMDEYDTPGGEPYAVTIGNYEFDSKGGDISLLQSVSKVSASCHCPFISSISPEFLGKQSMLDIQKIEDLRNYMGKSEFVKWNSFRQSEDSRYVGLTFPRFLLRLPYGPDTIPVKEFNYIENVTGADHDKYLWGNTSFSFAANVVRSFIDNGWCVQIRGPESGGKVSDLPIHFYDVGKGTQMKIPTEILISETRELEFANEGFIPLSIYKNRDYACFFSANSTQKPQEYDDPMVTANMRINSRLPYIFLVSRIAHYLKVLQRENIGAAKNKDDLQKELNRWLKGLVTEMPNPGPTLVSTHPLKAGSVDVQELEDNPGYFKVLLSIVPHFQIEGIDINLSLVSHMPKGK